MHLISEYCTYYEKCWYPPYFLFTSSLSSSNKIMFKMRISRLLLALMSLITFKRCLIPQSHEMHCRKLKCIHHPMTAPRSRRRDNCRKVRLYCHVMLRYAQTQIHRDRDLDLNNGEVLPKQPFVSSLHIQNWVHPTGILVNTEWYITRNLKSHNNIVLALDVHMLCGSQSSFACLSHGAVSRYLCRQYAFIDLSWFYTNQE